MNRPIVAIALLLALSSCGFDGRTTVVHIDRDGTDLLYSKVRQDHHVTEFRCLASETGACHYALFAHACGSGGRCDASPYHTFGVPVGQRLIDTTLKSDVVVCVGTQPGHETDNCPGHAGRT